MIRYLSLKHTYLLLFQFFLILFLFVDARLLATEGLTKENAPRDPRGWTVYFPTGFKNSSPHHAGIQLLEDQIEECMLEGRFKNRLASLVPYWHPSTTEGPMVIRVYHPNDSSEQDKAVLTEQLSRAWRQALPERRVVYEFKPMDFVPRFVDRHEKQNDMPESVAQVAPPDRTWGDILKDPAEVRRIKKRVGGAQAAALLAIHVAAASGMNPAKILELGIRQWAVFMADTIAEYGYKAYQTELSDWFEARGMAILFNVGLLGLARPNVVEALSAPVIGETISWFYELMLVGGSIAIVPQFLMGLRNLDALREMGHITKGERQLTMLKAGGFSLGSLGVMSSGAPEARIGLVVTLVGELRYYWQAKYRASTLNPVVNRIVLVHPTLYRNQLDLEGNEPIEHAISIANTHDYNLQNLLNRDAFEIVELKGPQPSVLKWFARGVGQGLRKTAYACADALAQMPPVRPF